MSKDEFGYYTFDFEKVRPRVGRSAMQAWGCDSSALNYKCICDTKDEISFSFETELYAPILVLFKFYTSYRKSTISMIFISSSWTQGAYFTRNVVGKYDTNVFQTLVGESSKNAFDLMSLGNKLWAGFADEISSA
jgi:hypothetical protein